MDLEEQEGLTEESPDDDGLDDLGEQDSEDDL